MIVPPDKTLPPPQIGFAARWLKRSTKPTGKGTGLGLSQVYGFMRQAGGA